MGSQSSKPSIPEDLRTRDQKRNYIRQVIDRYGFRWLVYAVAASGFLTDSWNIFATNLILPSLAFVYWPDETDGMRESLINCVTLGGSVVGQLLFGYLADRYGRTRFYGVELVIVAFSTVALVASSTGFLMGIGIGAEYPLSACICTEWASTGARAKMMVAVFLMQPLGQLAATLVAYGVLMGYSHRYDLQNCVSNSVCGEPVDGIWRWVAGVGIIPAAIALYFRWQIEDPGLYDLDVKDEGKRAVENTMRLYRSPSGSLPDIDSVVVGGDMEMQFMAGDTQTNEMSDRTEGIEIAEAQHADPGQAVENVQMNKYADQGEEVTELRGAAAGELEMSTFSEDPEPPLPAQFSWQDMTNFLWVEGNWRILAGNSGCWFLLDIAFYGLGLGEPATLAKIWTYYPGQTPLSAVPSWNPNAADPGASIYDALKTSAEQTLFTVCIGSVCGCVLLWMIIDYIPRKNFMIYMFGWLAVLFIATGTSFFSVFHTDNHAVSIVLVALVHFSLNLGPNPLTFLLPAELYPTRYRATCHRIAAASGELGSVMVQAVLPRMAFGGVLVTNPNSDGLGWVFIIYGFVMALAAFCAWVWIPAPQDHDRHDPNHRLRIPSKTLEVLGQGLRRARQDGQVIGLRENVTMVWKSWEKWVVPRFADK